MLTGDAVISYFDLQCKTSIVLPIRYTSMAWVMASMSAWLQTPKIALADQMYPSCKFCPRSSVEATTRVLDFEELYQKP